MSISAPYLSNKRRSRQDGLKEEGRKYHKRPATWEETDHDLLLLVEGKKLQSIWFEPLIEFPNLSPILSLIRALHNRSFFQPIDGGVKCRILYSSIPYYGIKSYDLHMYPCTPETPVHTARHTSLVSNSHLLIKERIVPACSLSFCPCSVDLSRPLSLAMCRCYR